MNHFFEIQPGVIVNLDLLISAVMRPRGRQDVLRLTFPPAGENAIIGINVFELPVEGTEAKAIWKCLQQIISTQQPTPIDAPAEPPTWQQLVEIEPRLSELEHEARAIVIPHKRRVCASMIWFGKEKGAPEFNSRVESILLEHAENPVFQHPEVFQRIVDHIFAAFPDCQHGAGKNG
jgi:hypothetical protein